VPAAAQHAERDPVTFSSHTVPAEEVPIGLELAALCTSPPASLDSTPCLSDAKPPMDTLAADPPLKRLGNQGQGFPIQGQEGGESFAQHAVVRAAIQAEQARKGPGYLACGQQERGNLEGQAPEVCEPEECRPQVCRIVTQEEVGTFCCQRSKAAGSHDGVSEAALRHDGVSKVDHRYHGGEGHSGADSRPGEDEGQRKTDEQGRVCGPAQVKKLQGLAAGFADFLGSLCCGFAPRSTCDLAEQGCRGVHVHKSEGVIASCQVHAAVQQCQVLVARGDVAWAAIVTHGMPGNPLAWISSDADLSQGVLKGPALNVAGENTAMVVTLHGGGLCLIVCSGEGDSFSTFW
jgi:hypothetical protein